MNTVDAKGLSLSVLKSKDFEDRIHVKFDNYHEQQLKELITVDKWIRRIIVVVFLFAIPIVLFCLGYYDVNGHFLAQLFYGFFKAALAGLVLGFVSCVIEQFVKRCIHKSYFKSCALQSFQDVVDEEVLRQLETVKENTK
jgi:hypothetical protein